MPLQWIPTLYHADPAEREKVTISADGTGLFWTPDQGEINEVLRVTNYLCTGDAHDKAKT